MSNIATQQSMTRATDSSFASYLRKLFAVGLLALLSACGGGGSGADTRLSGNFLDSAVSGLAYRTDTQIGTTDSSGLFYFNPGEKLTFYLQGMYVGEATGASMLTPSLIAPTGSNADYASNLLRMLQTIDTDQNPSNGIVLGTLSNVQNVNLRQMLDSSSASFATSWASANMTSNSLVSASDAIAHFNDTLSNEAQKTISSVSATSIDLTGRTATATMMFDSGTCANAVNTSWTLTFGAISATLTGSGIDSTPCLAVAQSAWTNSLEYVDRPSTNTTSGTSVTLRSNALFLPCGPVCTEDLLNQTYTGVDTGADDNRPFNAKVVHMPGTRDIYMVKTFTDSSTIKPRVIYYHTILSP